MLILTDELSMIQQAARDFVAAKSTLRRSTSLWREMAELGWLGLTIPEEHGGSGMGWRAALVILEELGRGLCPEPLVPALLGAQLLRQAGATQHLPALASGERLAVAAWQESGSRFAVDRPATRAEAGRLYGEKIQVFGGNAADLFIVSARDGLYLVAAGDAQREPQHLLDGRDAAIVRFDGAPAEKLAGDHLAGAIDHATVALCAEMLGAAGAAFAMTLDYLKTRTQFGVPIGSFQALQHRAAKLYVELELARSAVMRAGAVLDAGQPADAEVARAASVAKAKCSETFMLVGHEAIQMHGGIGMTDEHDIGLYLKRARVAEMTFGDAAFHRERFARLAGL